MKKQIVTACALIASVAAFATSVESSNTFGVLKIASTATAEKSAQLIIPVPWENVGTSTGTITATDYVLSTGRKVGDMLYWYDNSLQEPAYKVWTIKSENGSWEAATTYSIGKESYTVTAPDVGATIARGQAVILGLVAGSTGDIYLSGQYNKNTVKVPIYGPTTEQVAKLYRVSTLIAPSQASEVDVNTLKFYTLSNESYTEIDDTSVLKGDYIRLADGTTYTYSKNIGKWYKEGEQGSLITENLLIPSGQGAWYSRANAGTVYVEW